MKILVLNGSPKGGNSITLQHIRFLATRFQDLEVKVIPMARSIKTYERDRVRFDETAAKIKAADAVVWSFPVYYALVPSQMKRFMELLYQRKGKDFFQGTYTTALTTSINFFDHTAHNYVQAVCEDLGFFFIRGYSAHMDDFFNEKERQKLVRFFSWFLKTVSHGLVPTRKYPPDNAQAPDYDPGRLEENLLSGPAPSQGSRVLLLTDQAGPDTNLGRMIRVFIRESAMAVEVKDIRDSGMGHGCLGCCTCGHDNACIQKDGFTRFFNDHLQTADLILICGSIHDHFLSSVWKQFLDRTFFKGHAPSLKGKELGFMISGPLSRRQNLREFFDMLADNWHMKHRGVVTDEGPSSREVTDQIRDFARSLDLARETNLDFGPSFYRVGGQKLFRDFVFNSSAVFRADHLFYKAHRVYDTFPQRRIKKRLNNGLFSLVMTLPFLRRRIQKRFIPGMVAPYKKTLEKLSKAESLRAADERV